MYALQAPQPPRCSICTNSANTAGPQARSALLSQPVSGWSRFLLEEGNGGILKQKLLKATAEVLSSVKGGKPPLQVTVSSSGGWKQTTTSVFLST